MNTYSIKTVEIPEKIKVIKSFNQNGFKVTVCQYDISNTERKTADSQIKKQLLEYMTLSV